MKQLIGIVSVCLLTCGLVFADGEKPKSMSNEELMSELQKLQKAFASQQEEITELKSQLSEAQAVIGPAEEVSDEHVKALIRQQLAARPAQGAPAFLDGITAGGKLRLRHEYQGKRQFFTNDNDRNRFRYYFVYGFEKAITEEFSAGFEMASGGTSATSKNETIGDAFAKDDLHINMAYATYKPAAIEGLMILAGKHANNWDAVKSRLMWAPTSARKVSKSATPRTSAKQWRRGCRRST